ncbi:MAG TPA: 4Fe-4S dicluster domain-containing protein [Egibacteraceae bacterium]|jgi:formate dehydrogenase iron-sulfur subunit|nr:4Fe-4S dicluster domain-containing protein [Egibacteraceae bacterium]
MLGDRPDRTGNEATGYAPLPVAGAASRAPGYADEDRRPRMAFFTDTTVCIGCKACEVACKEWNDVPETKWDFTGHSYDNTGHLSADAWRHVAFIEQPARLRGAEQIAHTAAIEHHAQDLVADGFRWLMMSDVCKHCTTAGCLDNCPTGALFKTEFDSVVVQPDICNGCGYCVVGCPYGVISRRETDGKAWKCTMCYDRLRTGDQPACSKVCPTDSISFGSLDAMREMAETRLAQVTAMGFAGAHVYGDGEDDAAGVDGTGALFLLLDEPEVYGLPPDPVVATKHLKSEWLSALGAAAALALTVASAVAGGARRR